MRRVQPMICRNWPDEWWRLFDSWSCFHASSTNLIAGSTTSCFHCKRNFFFSEGSVQSEGNVDHCGIVRMLNPRARFLAALIQVSSVEANALTTILATGFVGGSVNIRARVQMTLTANLELNLHEPVNDNNRPYPPIPKENRSMPNMILSAL